MFASFKLYVGQVLDLDKFLPVITDYGYGRQEFVREEGDFSIRGNVIDIFPFSFELPIRIELDNDSVSSVRTFNPTTGDPLWEHRLVIILPIRKSSSRKALHLSEDFPLSNFIDLKIGDLVVHTQHGIGRFLGMEKVRVADKPRDHLAIEYDRKEKLLVPVDSMHLVQKYLAFHARRPKFHRLGSREWDKEKQRAKKGIQKLAWELISLQALRQTSIGFPFSRDTSWQKDFEDTFAYEETPDQIKAVHEVKVDMESNKPMDRLLCGDVGYGKTEVAMRAAFKAMMDNKQVAYLVPTTILAEQHYQNFCARLKDFPVNVELLCRFKTHSQQARILEGLAKGSVDMVIGTHRLLSDDVSFKDLGLLVVDEEQRFGVRAKEKLKQFRLTTDVLSLSATPIPRTLYLSLMGGRDMSVINTPPENRLPIKTIVVEYDEALIQQAVLKEFRRKGQTFFLHNRVEDIEKVRDKLTRLLPANVRLGIGHGQMHPKLLEKVMSDFLKGEIDCLVCTMIIESGIDIPNANTIIVDDAQMFGLSDMHQLRGRVGRFNRSAYAYFMVPRKEILDSDAKKRLEAIQEYSHLGAGFNIAMEDLEIRGAGNLLGLEQHGFIATVGFDLYCRLLREAIGVFKEAKYDKNQKSKIKD